MPKVCSISSACRREEITVEAVWDLVGAVPERDLLNLVRAIAADDSTALLERTRHLMDKGREPLIVLQSLVGFYRDLLIAKSAPARIDMVAITPPTWAEMTELPKSYQPRSYWQVSRSCNQQKCR